MKKKFTILGIILAVTMIFSACEGPEGPPGKNGNNGTNWEIIPFTVRSNQWVEYKDPNGLNRYYSCLINVPEITDFIATQGLVLCYLVYEDDVQIVLPSVRHYQDTNGNYWTQTIDFDFEPGDVVVYITNSDFVADWPPTMYFSLRLIW
ncbi:MAG: hypothetical protein FWD66_03310 [Paludibacter sp.]|nr:hypothetical protein [Paludibacter sp.]